MRFPVGKIEFENFRQRDARTMAWLIDRLPAGRAQPNISYFLSEQESKTDLQ